MPGHGSEVPPAGPARQSLAEQGGGGEQWPVGQCGQETPGGGQLVLPPFNSLRVFPPAHTVTNTGNRVHPLAGLIVYLSFF